MTQLLPAPASTFRSVAHLLRARSLRQPDRQAFCFLKDGETESESLTYAELDRRARAVAALLRRRGGSGERALLLYPAGLDFVAAFFGCLYAGVVAVPAHPPRFDHSAPRLQAITSDAQPAFVLTAAETLANFDRYAASAPGLLDACWLATDGLQECAADGYEGLPLDEGALAFLQYTSGSTSAPKGVMVSHGNLLHNLGLIREACGHDEASTFVGWLPLYHDMGLIGNVLQPLYIGALSVLMSPVAFLQRPLRWLQAVSRYGAHTSGGPDFAYNLCARKITDGQKAGLDLSRWRVAFNGAEPIRAETLERFAAAFEACGFSREAFYPCYGLAEATLMVSGGRKGDPPVVRAFRRAALERHEGSATPPDAGGSTTLVGCGRPLPGQHVVVVDPDTFEACPPGRVGEICLSGPSVAGGYWNRPEETRQTFHASAPGEAAPLLRTGDLGFLLEGELFITGRLKDLVIIRGRNHYPQDIELTAEASHPALRPGGSAAFSIVVEGEERLAVVQEVDRRSLRGVEAGEVIAAIRHAVLAWHEVQAYAVVLIAAGSIPKTSSGKIRRHACREEFLAGRLRELGRSVLDERAGDYPDLVGERGLTREALDSVEPERRLPLLEFYLGQMVGRVIGRNLSGLRPDLPLASLGLDSLGAVELQNRVESDLKVRLRPSHFFRDGGIARLASHVLESLDAPGRPEPTLPASEGAPDFDPTHPLSYGQQSLWFMHQLAPESAAYNIAGALRLVMELDVQSLRRALRALAGRHEPLRTCFVVSGGLPVQRVLREAEFDLTVEDASAWDEQRLNEALCEEAHRPFDIRSGPPLRLRLYRRSPREHVLLLAAHHLIADFWSLEVFMDELSALYSAERAGAGSPPLPPPAASYAHFTRWQAEVLGGAEGERLWAYWREALAGHEPVLNLTSDRPRPQSQRYVGATHNFRMGAELSGEVKRLGAARGVTTYVTLLAAFQALLHRYTGQADILVGSPSAGRSRAEFSELIGYFVNPVVLRARFSGGLSFASLLEQARRTVLGALEHRDYPFPLLVQRLQNEIDLSRPPLVQVMFLLQKPRRFRELAALSVGEAGGRVTLGEMTFEPVSLPQRAAQFDLTLTVVEAADSLVCSLQYNTDLFDAETVERMAEHFRVLLAGVLAAPNRPLSEVPLLTQAELRRALHDWNDTRVELPALRGLHELFEAQAERTPDATALFCEAAVPLHGRERFTYREVNRRANQLAHYLRSSGVGPEACVGVCAEPSLELLVGLLGVLKAGGAYLPLDPSYPRARLASMLRDAGAGVLLTQRRFEDALPPAPGVRVIRLDEDWAEVAARGEENPECRTSPDNLAYVMYTSGSTGEPKGVLIPHRGILNRMMWEQQALPLTEGDGVLQLASIGFDASVWEIFRALAAGARVVMVRPGRHSDTRYLVKLITEQRVTTVSLVPSTLRALLRQEGIEGCRCLKHIVCAGEPLTPDLPEQLFSKLQADLFNFYGQTEVSIDATFWKCGPDAGAHTLPVGRPLGNMQTYVLDGAMRPTPVGVAGEVYVAGEGLARGYLNCPGLSAERFIPHPFGREPGARLYRTGDLARYLPDGNLEFLGRADRQLKLHGVRLEAGEVESVLRQHPGVREVVVVLREQSPGRAHAAAPKTLSGLERVLSEIELME